MKKILITGGTGFVGGRLAKRLAKEHEVYISSRKRSLDRNALGLYGNVLPLDHKRLFKQDDFPAVDVVIHLAALNEWDSAKYPSEAIRVNIDETRIILENSIARGVERFIYFSTAHIYGSPLVGRITETTLPHPIHPYSITHRAAEDYIVAAGSQKRIHGSVLRLSNSFGAPISADVDRWTLLASDLCRQAVETGKMVLNSNGCQYRDFICMTDVEDVIASMIVRRHPLKNIIYNLGSGISMRVIDMVRIIESLCISVLKKNVPIELPFQAKETNETGLEFSIERLLEEGFRINNDVIFELESLLKFCADHFPR
jgi:UDP-glucose 4-epimerase